MCSALSGVNCGNITGGRPGLIGAPNEGARTAEESQGTRSIGIRVHLPFEQHVNPFVEQAFEHATFFTRLHHFVLTSDAYIVAPGGLGTVLESMMIWQTNHRRFGAICAEPGNPRLLRTAWWRTQSRSNQSLTRILPITGKNTGKIG